MNLEKLPRKPFLTEHLWCLLLTLLSYGNCFYIRFQLFRSNLEILKTVGHKKNMEFHEMFPDFRSSSPGLFLGNDVLKMCSKFTRKHLCRSVISIRLLCNFIEIAFRHGCFHVNLLHIFKTPFFKDSSGRLLLRIIRKEIECC